MELVKYIAESLVDKPEEVKLKQVEVPGVKGQETVREVLDFDEMADIFGMVSFEINIGANDGVNKVELADFVARTARVNEITVGQIEIGPVKTVVEIHKDVGLKVLRALRQSSYKGRKISVTPLNRKR